MKLADFTRGYVVTAQVMDDEGKLVGEPEPVAWFATHSGNVAEWIFEHPDPEGRRGVYEVYEQPSGTFQASIPWSMVAELAQRRPE